MFYDCTMLVELDHLTNRIERLVDRMKSLHSEAERLRQELARVSAERDALASQTKADDQTVTALKASLGTAEAAVAKTRAQAAEEKSSMQGTLDLFRKENETMQSALKGRESEVKRLREVNEQARKRIEGVLERLPGGLSQGSL